MKKILPALIAHIAVILAIVISFGVISVTADRSASGNEKFTGVLERNVTLHVLENNTAKEQGYLKELLDSFNERYKEYGIKAVDANIDQYNDLEQSGPFGYGPDVLYQANDAVMKYVDGHHILPLPLEKIACKDLVSENAWSAYEKNIDQQSYTFGVPVNIQQPLLFYRKDLLPADWETEWDDNKNGIPDMIENWSALYRFSKQIRQESGGKKYGYMQSLCDSYFSSGYLFSFGGYVFGGEDGTDTRDIGFDKGESYKGAKIVRQLASVMNMECTEFTVSDNRYSRLAEGTYFATMTTPDVYTMFIREMVNKGYTEEYAKENVVMVDVPQVPVSGDLEDESLGFKDMTVMGGVNGYAISSYTSYPNAALEFVNYATSYKMVKKRYELLGISPARKDVVDEIGGLHKEINDNLDGNSIYVMPSVRATAQIWPPMENFFSLIAGDMLENKNVYSTDEALKNGLKKVSKDAYDAIHTLSGS
ncbi:MAG: extracellular solute-binding protein [Clostridia bacterium]|nr:extracellular solute-binding protein [Clostridia bacterium]